MKRIWIIVLVIMLFTAMPVFSQTNFKLQINGQDVVLKDKIELIEGRTLLPFRAFFELVGAEVQWDGENRVAIGRNSQTEVRFPIGRKVYTVNNQTYEIDVPAQIINDRTYVPIRKAAESLGFVVDYKDGVINLINENFSLSTGKKGWKHPAGYFSLELGEGWNIEEIPISRALQGSSSNSIVQVMATKDGYKAQIQHFPCKGISDSQVKKGLVAPYEAVGARVVWDDTEIAGKDVSVTVIQALQKTWLAAYSRWGDLGISISVWSDSEVDQEKMKEVLAAVVGSIKCSLELPADPTNGNTGLLGKWTSSTYEGSGGRSAGGTTTLTFSNQGMFQFHEIFSVDVYVSGYTGASTENTVTGYYRVLGDIIYLYNDSAIQYVPYSLGRGMLLLGQQQFVKANY